MVSLLALVTPLDGTPVAPFPSRTVRSGNRRPAALPAARTTPAGCPFRRRSPRLGRGGSASRRRLSQPPERHLRAAPSTAKPTSWPGRQRDRIRAAGQPAERTCCPPWCRCHRRADGPRGRSPRARPLLPGFRQLLRAGARQHALVALQIAANATGRTPPAPPRGRPTAGSACRSCPRGRRTRTSPTRASSAAPP